jgi:dCMP deaminase
MKQKWINAFMDTADRFGQLSTAKRLQVGSVIVKDNRIISIGYNGMPSGWDNVCEHEGKTKEEVIHAEANAISKLARSVESGLGSTMFVTHAPCIQCAKLIYGAGVEKVYYRHTYRETTGIDFLSKCGVTTEQV